MLFRGVSRLVATSHRVVPRRFAGHSKWANIKETKAKMDDKRLRMINRMVVRIRGAIQVGGCDPHLNVPLRHVIEEAALNDIPKATVTNILQRYKDAKNNLRDAMVEIRGPAGSCFLISLCCTNLHVDKAAVRNIARKHRVSLENAMHAFDKAAYVVTDVPEGLTCGEEEEGELSVPDRVTDDAIVSGAEEVHAERWEHGSVLIFSSGWDEVMAVRKSLSELGYSIRSTDKVYEPREMLELSPDDFKKVSDMCDKLKSLEAFSSLTTNVAGLEQ